MARKSATVSGYWTTANLLERFKISRATLYRWMDADSNPFPRPQLLAAGSQNRWAIEDVTDWEDRARGRAA